MISYPIELGKPLLQNSDFKQALSFSRTKWDYGVRQRKTYKGYDTSGFSIIIPHHLLDSWYLFWETLNFGTDSFLADFFCFGSDNLGKTLRFIDVPTVRNIGALKFEISGTIELISSGTVNTNCYPSNTSYPSSTSYPCIG